MYQPKVTIHIAKLIKSQPHEPKLVKEYICPNAENEMKNKKRQSDQTL